MHLVEKYTANQRVHQCWSQQLREIFTQEVCCERGDGNFLCKSLTLQQNLVAAKGRIISNWLELAQLGIAC